MKLKELVKLPKIGKSKMNIDEKWGYNLALKECGDIEVEVDVEKLTEIISYQKPRHSMETEDEERIAQAIAQNIKEILKNHIKNGGGSDV